MLNGHTVQKYAKGHIAPLLESASLKKRKKSVSSDKKMPKYLKSGIVINICWRNKKHAIWSLRW